MASSARPAGISRQGSDVARQLPLTPTHHVTAIQNNPRTSIFSMISGDEYETWYELAADLTSPTPSTSSGAPPLDLSTAEGRSHAEASVSEFSHYLRTIGDPFTEFAANRRDRPAAGANEPTTPRAGAEPVSMDEVPTLLFDEGFRLEEPSTFALFSPEGSPAATMVQQERLTHYLDLVEVNLLHAVSTRSEDFYTALDSWQGLTELVAAGVAQIEGLRGTVSAIDQRLARTALRLPFLCRQRSNQLRLHRQLVLIATIRTAQPTIQALLSAEDYLGALELIGSTQTVLRAELQGVRCFTHLDEELAETARSLTQLMVQELMRTIMAPGLHPDSSAAAGQPPSAAERAKREAALEAARAKVGPLLLGLLRQGALAAALAGLFESLRAQIKAEVKSSVATILDELRAGNAAAAAAERAVSADFLGGGSSAGNSRSGPKGDPLLAALTSAADDGMPAHGTIADQLCALSSADSLSLLARVGHALLGLLQRAQLLSAALGHVTEQCARARAARLKSRPAAAAGNGTGGADPAKARGAEGGGAAKAEAAEAEAGEAARDAAALSDLAKRLGSACDVAAERYAKLISVRAHVNAKLTLSELAEMHRAATAFACALESLGGSSCVALRNTLAAQARAFADGLHESSKQKLASTLDCERWAQAEVHPRFQRLADALLRHTAPPSALGLLGVEEGAGGSGLPAASLVVGGQPFRVVGCALLLLELLAQQVQLSRLFPEIAVHLLPLLAELLATWNTRSFQLVLGAGAIQLVGLQRISSKILALLSQSLGLVIALMPHLRASIALQLPAAQHALLAQLDRIVHDYREHERKILGKLVSIMLDRVANSDAMHAALSGQVSVLPGQPSPYMAELVKDAQSLHRVLSPILTREQIESVHQQILTGFDAKLVAIFSATNTADMTVAHRITTDIAHLITAMMQLQPESTQLCCPQLAKFAQNIASGATSRN